MPLEDYNTLTKIVFLLSLLYCMIFVRDGDTIIERLKNSFIISVVMSSVIVLVLSGIGIGNIIGEEL